MALAVISTVPVAFAENLGDDWAAIKKGAGNAYKAETTAESLEILAETKALYEKSFASAAQIHDPETHNVIMDCYADSQSQYENGDKAQAKLINQCLEKSIYTLGMVMMKVSVEENDAEKYLEWSKIVQKKFKVSEKDPATSALFATIENNPSKLQSYSEVIRENMLDIFEIKTVEELEEALIKYAENDTQSAKKYAYEGLYYYRTLHPYVVESIGNDKAERLMDYMIEAKAVSDSANNGVPIPQLISEMKSIKKEVEKTVMEHNGIEGSADSLALAGILDRLYLVKVEYIDAIDASGNIINEMEYAETVAFAAGALEIAEENSEVLTSISSSEFDELTAILSSIQTDVNNKESISQVLNSADGATAIVKSMQSGVGESGSNLDGYFDTINRLLLSAEAAYSNGDSDLAFELVSQAYLDNYEFLEAPIGEVDTTLMKSIEDEMREELRNMIKSGASVVEVTAQIQMISDDLDAAKIKLAFNTESEPTPAPSVTQTTQSSDNGGCLIATATYGSEMAPQVQFLREIRDNQLMNTESGIAFMSGFNQVYYSFSPYIADLEREHPMFKEVVKLGITPMLSTLSIMEIADSEEEVLGLGISVIALNIGMYLGIPAIVIVGIRKKNSKC